MTNTMFLEENEIINLVVLGQSKCLNINVLPILTQFLDISDILFNFRICNLFV